MEDSPLSVVASITGILTFFAAIMGFVYVRYEVLQNGTTEMNSILDTAMSTIGDNEVWNEVMRDMVQNRGRFERRDTLQRELFKIQFQILTEYHSADLFTPAVAMLWATAMTRTVVSTFWRDIDPEAWSKFRQKLQCREYPLLDNSGNDSGFGNVLEMRISKRPLGLVWRLLVNFGASPALLRWYMIREKVLEKVRRRETIQSQLLLYQISTANSAAQTLLSDNEFLSKAVKKLMEGNDILKLELVQLRRRFGVPSTKPYRARWRYAKSQSTWRP